MPVPVMDCAYTGIEPKCSNAITGTGISALPIPVTDYDHTGTETMCNYANTGTGTNFECQFR